MTPPIKEKTAFDKMLKFMQKSFLHAGFDGYDTPSEPTETLVQILTCSSSQHALRLLRCLAGHMKKGFWVQPTMLNQLRKGLIVGESLGTPEGLTPFGTPCCPVGLTLQSFDEGGQTVSVAGVRVSSTCGELKSRHGREGKAGAIVPKTIDELIHHISNFNFLITLIFGEKSLLSVQYAAAVQTISAYSVDLMSLAMSDSSLPGKILWFLHLRTQAFLKSCSEAIDEAGIHPEALEWEARIMEVGQGMGGIVDSAGPAFLRWRHDPGDDGRVGAPEPGTETKAVNRSLLRSLRGREGRNLFNDAEQRKVPPPLTKSGVPMCLDFHLLGRCGRNLHCPLRATHGYISQGDFESFNRWVLRERKLMRDSGGGRTVPDGNPPSYGNNGRAHPKGRG